MKQKHKKSDATTHAKSGKKLLRIFLTVLMLALVAIPLLAWAQAAPVPVDPAAGNSAAPSTAETPLLSGPIFSSTGMDKMLQSMGNFLTLVLTFFQSMLFPLLLMIGSLLKPDLFFASDMETAMLALWTNIRNIVNILFVLVLLGVAFYNIIGGKQQDYHVKAILPKFVIALIAVNFSFLVVKIAVDATSILTTAIFALPNAVQRDLAVTPDFEKSFCEGIYGKFAGNEETYEKNVTSHSTAMQGTDTTASGGANNEAFCKPDAPAFSDSGWAKTFFATFDSSNAGLVMAINLGQIAKLDTVMEGGVVNLKTLTLNIIFSIVLYLVYTISFLVLFIVLIVRMVAIWVVAVLSPLLALEYVLPENMKNMVGGGDMKEQFIKTIVAPLPIAVVMSIGFVMLSTLKAVQFGVNGGDPLTASTLGLRVLTSNVSTLQDLVAAIGTVAVIWVGVFKAASGTFANGIVEGIKTTAEGAGKWLVTSPLKYARIFPAHIASEANKGQKEPISLADVGNVANALKYGKERESQSRAEGIVESMGFGTGGNSKAIRSADTPKAAMQVLLNASRNRELKDGNFQKDFAQQVKEKNWNQGDFDFREINRLSGGKYKDKEAFMKALEGNEVDKDIFEKWIEHNRNSQSHFAGMTAETLSQPSVTPPIAPVAAAGIAGAAGTAATTPEADADNKAKKNVTDAQELVKAPEHASREQVLSEPQKQALAKAQGVDEKDVSAVTADPILAEAVQELREIKEGQEDFKRELAGKLVMDNEGERVKEVNTTVTDRRNVLKGRIAQNNPAIKDDDKELTRRANVVIYSEMKDEIENNRGNIVKNPDAVAVQEVITAGEAAQSQAGAPTGPLPPQPAAP